MAGRPGLAAQRELDAARTGGPSSEVSRAMFRAVLSRLTGLDERLRDMDGAGVAVQVVSPSPTQYHPWADEALARDIWELTNEGVAAFCARSPERFTGLGVVPLQHGRLAVGRARPCRDRLRARRRGDLVARPVTRRRSSCRPVGSRAGSVLGEGRGARRRRVPAPARVLARRPPRPVVPVERGRPARRARRRPVPPDLRGRPRPPSRACASSPPTAAGTCPTTSAGAITPGSSARTAGDAPTCRAATSAASGSTRSCTTPACSGRSWRVAGADRIVLGSDYPFDMGVPDPVDRLLAAGLGPEATLAVASGNAALLGPRAGDREQEADAATVAHGGARRGRRAASSSARSRSV